MTRHKTRSRDPAQKCVLCGEALATTRDHIPPKSIYPKPRISLKQLHTVPACRQCNNRAGIEDEEFKIVMGFLTGEFRENQKQIIYSMARTIGFNQRLASQVFSTKQTGYAHLHGPILESAVRVTFQADNYSKVLQRIVRGLHWTHTGRILGKNIDVRVFPLQALTPDVVEAFRQLMGGLPTHRLNKDTFAYKVCFADDRADIWGMQFFHKHVAFAYVKHLPEK